MQTKSLISTGNPSNFYNLKNEAVALVPQSRSDSTVVSIADLEALRTTRAATPASKHGLEAICGASCETGAQ